MAHPARGGGYLHTEGVAMNARSTSVWIAALALGLGSDVAAAAQASTPSNGALLGASGNDNEWVLPAKNYEGDLLEPGIRIAFVVLGREYGAGGRGAAGGGGVELERPRASIESDAGL